MSIDIDIKDFQSLEQVKLRVEKFTTLIGGNNLGKSAVTRAVRSVAKNKGDGTRLGAKFNEVTLSNEHFKVVRKKGTKFNDYRIEREGYGSVDYTKVNRDVPEEIAQLGFKPIQVGRDKVFVQFPNQFEKIFLLDRPSAVVAEALSKISNIEVINRALRAANRDRKQKESLLKVRRSDVENLKEKLKQFERLEELNILSDELKQLKREHGALEQTLEELEAFRSEVTDHKSRIEHLSRLDEVSLPRFDFLILDEVTFLSTQLELLRVSKERLKRLSKTKEVVLPEVDSVTTLSEEVIFISDSLDAYKNQAVSVKLAEEELADVLKEIEDLAEEIAKIKQTETCPFKDVFACTQDW